MVNRFNAVRKYAVEGAAPDDVRESTTHMFRTTTDNMRASAAEAAGALRAPVVKTEFRRKFKIRQRQSEGKTLRDTEGGLAMSDSGKRVPLKRALPVPISKATVPVP